LYDGSPRIAGLIIGAFVVEILAVIGMFGVGSNHIEGQTTLRQYFMLIEFTDF
jgi:hypothetical protein